MPRERPTMNRSYTYICAFDPEADGGYTVTCPALPGLVTYGATLDEARTMAAEAIAAYLESLQKDGLAVPDGDDRRDQVLHERVTASLQTV